MDRFDHVLKTVVRKILYVQFYIFSSKFLNGSTQRENKETASIIQSTLQTIDAFDNM